MAKRKQEITPTEQADPPAIVPPPVDPERVEQIVKLILQGKRDFDVIRYIRRAWPDQDPAPLLIACGGHFQKQADFKPAVILGWCFSATMEVYRRMLEAGDLVGALRAIKQLRELSG